MLTQENLEKKLPFYFDRGVDVFLNECVFYKFPAQESIQENDLGRLLGQEGVFLSKFFFLEQVLFFLNECFFSCFLTFFFSFINSQPLMLLVVQKMVS